MIEFNGQLSGTAEKRFLKRSADYGQIFLLAGELLVFPVIILLAVCLQNWILIWTYLIFSVLILLMARIPKSKKERDAITPNRIYTKDNQIVCVAEKYVEYRNIADVKCIRDFGEFYELVFPFGRISEKFICQKDLLTKGTSKEFEALFGGKIIRI